MLTSLPACISFPFFEEGRKEGTLMHVCPYCVYININEWKQHRKIELKDSESVSQVLSYVECPPPFLYPSIPGYT